MLDFCSQVSFAAGVWVQLCVFSKQNLSSSIALYASPFRLSPYNYSCLNESTSHPNIPILLCRRSKVLTIHGSEDETIPVADAHEFDKVLLNNELVVVEGATHRFATEPEQEAVMKALNRCLGESGQPAPAGGR